MGLTTSCGPRGLICLKLRRWYTHLAYPTLLLPNLVIQISFTLVGDAPYIYSLYRIKSIKCYVIISNLHGIVFLIIGYGRATNTAAAPPTPPPPPPLGYFAQKDVAAAATANKPSSTLVLISQKAMTKRLLPLPLPPTNLLLPSSNLPTTMTTTLSFTDTIVDALLFRPP
jgi:hypothetical protein